MSSGCGDVLSLADLQTAKKHQIFEAEVITGKSGGVAGGADIDYATNQVTGQTQKTLPAVLRDAGFSPVSWDFSTGGTLAVDDRDKVVYDPVSKTWYSYAGTLPVVVPASFNPVGNADWEPQTDPNLRNDLLSPEVLLGDNLVTVKQPLVGAIARSLHDKNAESLSIMDFGAIGDGVAHPLSERFSTLADAQAVYPFVTSLTQTIDWAAIQAALNAAKSRGAGTVYIPAAKNNASYMVGDTIVIPTYVNVFGDGLWSRIQAVPGEVDDVVKIDTGPSLGPMFLRDFTIVGGGGGVGMGTTMTQDADKYKYVYGYMIQGIHVENTDTAYQFQGLWHSTMQHCSSGDCRVGLHIWGQNVSNHIVGCHFRQQNTSKFPNSIGILINTRKYDFQQEESQSEAIIIDGETMCIGFDVGIWAQAGLDFHFSNLDLDYIGSHGIIVEDVNATFNLSDSWIAADAGKTGQFIGVNLRNQTVGQLKNLRGLHIIAKDNPINDVGIQLIDGALTNIEGCTMVGGAFSVYLRGSSNISLKDNVLGAKVYFHDNQNCTIVGNRIDAGVDYSNTSGTLSNAWGENSGASTKGKLKVTMLPNATTGTVNIPAPIGGGGVAKYSVSQLHVDPIDQSDVVSLSGNTITVSRAAPSPAFQIDAIVEYTIVY